MSVALTSKTAYEKIQDKLGIKQLAVYEAIGELGVATNEQISEYLNWPINCVCGRSTELRRFGMIGFETFKVGKSGRKAQAWSIRNLNDRQLTQLTIDCGV